MEKILNKIVTCLEKFAEWIRSTLNKLIERRKKNAEIRREAEIENLVSKLYSLDAIRKIPANDLTYVQHQLNQTGREHIWEVDYKHKYLYGRNN